MWGRLRRLGATLLSVIPGGQTGGGGGARWRALARFERAVRVVAFWAAVVLPFLYLPMLFSGLGSQGEAVTLGALIAVHVVALSLGHPYAADGR